MNKSLNRMLVVILFFLVLLVATGCRNDETLDKDSVAVLMPKMIQVGENGVFYTMPVGLGDLETTVVQGGFYIAETETTYELWFYVREWAEDNGYTFENMGLEGSYLGVEGSYPSDSKLQPVTSVSWWDTIIWLNALSELFGYEPVYRSTSGEVIRDSREEENEAILYNVVITENNGYRLPESDEWELAARWQNQSDAYDNATYVSGRFWTPGNFASGASANVLSEMASREVAWYYNDPLGRMTHEVNQLKPNQLGIYDMSGNVGEWTASLSEYCSVSRVVRGGGFTSSNQSITVSSGFGSHPSYSFRARGFRIAIDTISE